MAEDDSVDIENENGNRFEEYEWCGQKRIRATTLLEEVIALAGFLGAEGHCVCACRCGNMISLGSSAQQSCTNEIFHSPYFVLNLSVQRQIRSA